MRDTGGVETDVQHLQHSFEEGLHLQGKVDGVSRPAAAGRGPSSAAAAMAITQSARHVQTAFGDLLALPPSALILPIGAGGREQEAKMWEIFADVYEQEVQHQLLVQQQQQQQQQEQQHHHQQQQRGQDSTIAAELSKEKRRQILADILVWAEITQVHYDTSTASFVTGPHDGDASFQRIGRLFKAAKKQRGLA